jgi:hypothetical protein
VSPQNYQVVGACYHETGANKLITCGWTGSGSGVVFEIIYWSDPVTYSTGLYTGPTESQEIQKFCWLKLVDDNTDLKVYRSTDPNTWGEPIWSEARTTRLTANRVGITACSANTGYTASVILRSNS